MARQLSEAVDLLEAASRELVLGHIASMDQGALIELQLSRLREHAVEAGLLIDRARGMIASVAMEQETADTSAAERRTA